MATGAIKNSGWTLLWENPSPLSSVAETRFAIDLTGYKEVKFNFYRNKVNTVAEMIFLPAAIFDTADLASVTQSAIFGIINSSNTIYRRFITNVDSTGFTIGSAFGASGGGSGDYLIPTKIYGR